ncbi:hypothetical protein [Orrella daihaiensis]|uniref:Uncharacterized protein n=1 Tax=Orrella daihaiensis TaxID=2782176 RepID=A0ABY4AL24_9BURK|nr:hypothetical protein [Orrella daihaiensis]UOD50105.1 hypothetical protein DHf2319_11785 [Orrella daihaiensis]
MKVLIWGVFVLAVLVWTGFAALVAQAIAWSSDRLSTGAVGALEMATNQIVIPGWASAWLAPSDWATVFMFVQSAIDNAAATVPLLTSVLGWIAPLVWVVWALGLAGLFALLIMGTLLIKRFGDRRHQA